MRILDNPEPKLTIPPALVQPVNAAIQKNLTASNLSPFIERTQRSLTLLFREAQADAGISAFKNSLAFICTTSVLQAAWVDRYNVISRLLDFMHGLEALKQEDVSAFIADLPAHLKGFVAAQMLALLANAGTAPQRLNELRTVEKQYAVEAEEFFFLTLARYGAGAEACRLAKESSGAATLLLSTQRAWLSLDEAGARAELSPADFGDDTVAHILLRAPGADRVAFLRELTRGGTQLLPTAL